MNITFLAGLVEYSSAAKKQQNPL